MSAENPGRPEQSEGNGKKRSVPERTSPPSGPEKEIFAKSVDEGNDTSPRRAEVSPEKATLIRGIIQTDKQAFRAWKEEQSGEPSLDIPESALRVLIPPKLFETVEDPEALSVVVDREFSDPESISFFIVEKKPETSNLEEALESGFIDDGTLESGILGEEDYVHNAISLEKNGEGADTTLHVYAYTDRTENRGQGVTTSFYEQLREVAKESGYAYLTGEANDRNVGYFTDRLGRKRFDELEPEEQAKFADNVEDPRYFTVDKLSE